MADEAIDEAGRRSLKALAWAIGGMGTALLGLLVVTGDPLVPVLMPYILGTVAILLGLRVWNIDTRPKATWKGTAMGAMALGVLVLVRAGVA